MLHSDVECFIASFSGALENVFIDSDKAVSHQQSLSFLTAPLFLLMNKSMF